MKLFIGFILNILYLALFIVVVKNTFETRQMLKQELAFVQQSDFRPMAVAINLKINIMSKYFIVAGCYFFYELIINGLIPTFNGDSESFNPFANVIQQFYDLFIIVCLLIVFRPRIWPEYFSLGFEAAYPDLLDQ